MSYLSGSAAEVNMPANRSIPACVEPMRMGSGGTFRPHRRQESDREPVRGEPGARCGALHRQRQ